MRSYRPEELFDEDGRLRPGARRAGADGRAADGRQPARQRRPAAARPAAARLPRLCRDGRPARRRDGRGHAGARAVPARCHEANDDARNFRVFGPDETASNRLAAPSSRSPTASGWPRSCRRRPPVARRPGDGGPVASTPCQGWLEGYLLTGRHGLLLLLRGVHPHRRLDVQPARQVAEDVARELPWRRPIASLNYLLTSHVWRQDHNGFSHQDPGFIDHVVNKKADVVRVYLPPDANTLLSVDRPLPAQPATT